MARRVKSLKTVGITKVHGKTICGALLAVVSLIGNAIGFAAYQRDRNKKHVARIAEGFDSDAVVAPRLSLRNGKLWVIDGGHTIAAMIQRGVKAFDAVVYEGLTYSQEAHLFYIWNDCRKQMAGWIKFFADLEGGNRSRQRMLDVAHKYRLTVPRDKGVIKSRDADISNSSTLTESYRKGGLELVDRVCRVLSKSWKVNGRVMYSAKEVDLIRGLIGYLKGASKADVAHAIAVLKEVSPEEIRRIANGIPSKGRIDSAQIKQAFTKRLAHVAKSKAA